MLYHLTPLKRDDDSGRLKPIALEKRKMDYKGFITAKGNARTLIMKEPECICVRIYKGTKLITEVWR